MNENIDLTKMLKDCPKGWKFYSSIYGDVAFRGIENDSTNPIKFFLLDEDNIEKYGSCTEQGLYAPYYKGECTLFPSKDQRDWSKFTAPWYKKEMDTIARIEKQGEPNPYSGVSFKYNGHTWGMCGRDNGVEILVDGEIKERIFLDNKPKGKSAIEAIKEEKVDNELTKTLCSEYTQKLYNPSNTGKNEQKSADKIKPRFKVGDWIVRGDIIAQILNIQEQYYVGLDINGKDFVSSRFLNGDKIHLWTINDAKDGDVLALSWLEDKNLWEKIIIFKKYHSEGIKGFNMPCIEGYGITFKNGKIAFTEKVPYYFKTWACNLYPVTKEQRDLLFQKIKETGYKWNTETNTFEKLVEPKFKVGDKIVNSLAEYMGAPGSKGKISEITDDKYIFTDSSYISISDQDSWELVSNKKPKFDPKTLKPFDKVLVKDFDETSYWTCNLFSHYNKNKGFYYCSSVPFDICIPYNDETKNLVDTTEEAPEYYRYWEK